MGIEFRDLTVSYDGSKTILEGINWEIKKGDFWAVIGPNGAGKSTIFRTILKRTIIMRGDVLIDGHSIKRLKIGDIARRAAVLLQTEMYDRSMKVGDYVALGRFPYLKLLGRAGKVDREIIHDALEKTNSLVLKDRLIGELSSGELQRVRIARVLAQGSEYIFLDEPTAHLDYEHKFEIMELLKKLKRTVVCILHDFDFAFRYARKILVLSEGKIEAQGDIESVFNAELFRRVFRVRISRSDSHIHIDPLLQG